MIVLFIMLVGISVQGYICGRFDGKRKWKPKHIYIDAELDKILAKELEDFRKQEIGNAAKDVINIFKRMETKNFCNMNDEARSDFQRVYNHFDTKYLENEKSGV